MRLDRSVGVVGGTLLAGLAALFWPGTPGDIAAFAWTGLFPGLALASLLLPGAPGTTRWTLGVVLAPLASTVAGYWLLHAGVPLPSAARFVAIGGWVLFAGGEARSLGRAAPSGSDAPATRAAWGWSLAAAGVVALLYLSSAWLRVRSDSWVHAGIVWDIVERGIPPQDPRFSGHPLNYVWFYNLFVALTAALRPDPAPFTVMATANVCWMGVQLWLGWQLAWTVWREPEAARAGPPLLLAGLNAGALLLWPLWFVRALGGDVRGVAEVRRIVESAHWDRTDVLYQLSAPFAWMVNSWDKFTVGTALGYAYLLLLVSLWAGARWLGDDGQERPAGAPPAWRWLLVAFVAAAGMILFHSVVGLSAIPVTVAACAVLALLGRLQPGWIPPRRAMALGVASLAGLAATVPYIRSITRGWSPEQSGQSLKFLHFGWQMPWTLLTACGLTAWAALPALRNAFAARRHTAVWLVAWTVAMIGFALVVHLPESNELKFVWQVFAPLAILGAAGLPALLAAWRRRLGPVLASLLAVVCFVAPTALLVRGYLADPSGATAPETKRAPGEPALYAWVRTQTPARAVFLDDRSRDVLLVEGRRRLLAGSPFGPERAAMPPDVLARRRAVSADLYGAGADLDGDVALLDSLAAPVYVLYRAADHAGAAPWTALEGDTARFERVYGAEGFRVYRRRAE